MDQFTRKDLHALMEGNSSPCVSLLMPTTRGARNEDKIRWKNLIREAETKLQNERWKGRREGLLEPARALLEDAPFWLNVSTGLAGYFAPGVVRTYRLAVRPQPKVVVAEHFHVKPLLSLLMDDGRFFVLALSQKHVRLLSCTRASAEEIELRDMPTSLTEAMHYGDELKMRTLHSHPAASGPAGRQEAIFHGHGVGVDSAKDGLLEYCHEVDRGLRRHLTPQEGPLVVAADEGMFAIYRQANSYSHLLTKAVPGHPDRLSSKELRDRAWTVVVPHFQKRQEEIIGLYRQLAGTGRTASAPAEIVKAAYEGQIQYLFVALDREIPGTFDTNKLTVQQETGGEDLLNLAALYTLQHKGTVFALEADKMPDPAPMAAIFWLPLGQRSGKRVLM
jgi:hypothetical protein